MKGKVLGAVLGCGWLTVAAAGNAMAAKSFTMADFASVEKVDIHVHIRTLDTALTPDAVQALGALAHEHRLAIYRLLVERGPEGLAAGVIAGMPAADSSTKPENVAGELIAR